MVVKRPDIPDTCLCESQTKGRKTLEFPQLSSSKLSCVREERSRHHTHILCQRGFLFLQDHTVDGTDDWVIWLQRLHFQSPPAKTKQVKEEIVDTTTINPILPNHLRPSRWRMKGGSRRMGHLCRGRRTEETIYIYTCVLTREGKTKKNCVMNAKGNK